MIKRPRYILLAIVVAQLLGTSTWFAGNAILPVLQVEWSLPNTAVAELTNSVQLGFIVGALLFAFLALADRMSPRLLFFICALGTAFFNLQIAFWAESLNQVLLLRFFGGMMLAGVYPVGMKIATGWYPEGLGLALGYLVGALALGTSSGHLFASFEFNDWQSVIYLTSGCSVVGGLLVLFWVPDGPALHKGGALRFRHLWVAMKHKPLQASAGGYFGHMWELYAVLALAPYWFIAWEQQHGVDLNIPFWSFYVIGIGGLGCMLGGHISIKSGSWRVARFMLFCSGVCCFLSPFVFELPFEAVVVFWTLWGLSVVADSPQFSALSARTAPKEVVGSALTMINAIGFTITIIATQITAMLLDSVSIQWIMLLLAPGPVLGLLSLRRLKKIQPDI
ncbi:MAG: MFS family permease [Neptuniibacter pectenicola]|jgi:MFS family permease|nr:MAG: hypothetical protein AXW15_09330 [Neptuniibacter sp. Phe_28]